MEDNEIVELYLERSERAVAETAAKYGRYCRTVAYNVLRSSEDADESVNDAYLALWNSIPPHRPQSLSAFLGKIVRRIAVNRLKMSLAAKRGGHDAALPIDELEECLPSGMSAETLAEENALRSAVSSYLRTLSETKRRVFVCRYWYSYSVKEIAERSGFSETKVSNMLARVRQGLRAYLEKEEFM